MTILIGTDEAGYGPNLGPLVISATVWQTPAQEDFPDLYHELETCVTREPLRKGSRHVPIADSKLLYSSGSSLMDLEAGLFPALATAAAMGQTVPARWRNIWEAFDPLAATTIAEEVWFRDYDEPLPIDLPALRSAELTSVLQNGLQAKNVVLRRICSRVVFPAEFNALCERHQNKGAALSATTLELICTALTGVNDQNILVQCDKHGGRNKYAALLQHYFNDHLIEVRQEGREQSCYRYGPPGRRMEFRFVAKGESFLPSALASMASKYLRELAMRAFNRYWQGEVPGLKPTAGYPVDAVRFKHAIQKRQAELGISDGILWRNR